MRSLVDYRTLIWNVLATRSWNAFCFCFALQQQFLPSFRALYYFTTSKFWNVFCSWLCKRSNRSYMFSFGFSVLQLFYYLAPFSILHKLAKSILWNVGIIFRFTFLSFLPVKRPRVIFLLSIIWHFQFFVLLFSRGLTRCQARGHYIWSSPVGGCTSCVLGLVLRATALWCDCFQMSLRMLACCLLVLCFCAFPAPPSGSISVTWSHCQAKRPLPHHQLHNSGAHLSVCKRNHSLGVPRTRGASSCQNAYHQALSTYNILWVQSGQTANMQIAGWRGGGWHRMSYTNFQPFHSAK